MIITVTLNPAIDQTLVLPRFVAGDTIRVRSSRFDPGGKGINHRLRPRRQPRLQGNVAERL